MPERNDGKLNTPAEHLFLNAEKRPDRAALISEHGVMSWGELEHKSGQLAAYLRGKGIRKGDRIAYRLPGGEDFYVLYLACSMLGCTAVGIGMQFTDSEIRTLLDLSKPSIYIDGKLPDEYLSLRPYYGNGMAGPDDRLFALYTSGTTGTPKGIGLTQRNVVTSAKLQAQHFCNGCNEDDIFQLQVPVNHVSGAVEWAAAAVIAGCASVLNERFDADKVLANTEKYRITMLCGVPSMWAMMLPKASNYDLSSVRWCMSGASPVTARTMERIKGICPEVSNPLGLTETAGFCTYSDPHASTENLIETVGRPVIPCRIMAEPGEIGQIAWNGDTISPDAPRNDEGWFVSGDLGYIDEEGQLHLKGRSDDVYFTGGYTIYPAEIEQVIMQHPDVAECVVVPEESKLMGSISKAVIVLRPGKEITSKELRNFAEDRLVYYKVPRRYEFRQFMPRNSMGKVIRKKLISE